MAALNPFKKPVDPAKLSDAERKIFDKYGVPGGKKNLMRNQKEERKYFDSGDYAMAKAGKADDGGKSVGIYHPSPETIPHLSTTTPTPNLQPQASQSGVSSPVKEASILQRGVSVDEQEGADAGAGQRQASDAQVSESEQRSQSTDDARIA